MPDDASASDDMLTQSREHGAHPAAPPPSLSNETCVSRITDAKGCIAGES